MSTIEFQVLSVVTARFHVLQEEGMIGKGIGGRERERGRVGDGAQLAIRVHVRNTCFKCICLGSTVCVKKTASARKKYP